MNRSELAKKLGITEGELILTEMIDKLSNEERKQLREALEANGMKNLPRNLYFNYETQEWI